MGSEDLKADQRVALVGGFGLGWRVLMRRESLLPEFAGWPRCVELSLSGIEIYTGDIRPVAAVHGHHLFWSVPRVLWAGMEDNGLQS